MGPALGLKLPIVTMEKPSNGEKFILPSWAKKPSCGAALHVIKGGDTVSTLKLDGDAKYYMFGRAPKTCEEGHGFVIQHLTLSRQHAVIVHAENDALYVIDLGSAYGTWVNKQKIAPYTPVHLENANILTFGQSTRRYVVRLFPKVDQFETGGTNGGGSGGSMLSLSYQKLAGLRVSTHSDSDIEDDDDEDEGDMDDVSGSGNYSPSKIRERQSLKQARLYTGLNATVSYPSPKSLLANNLKSSSSDGDSPHSPSNLSTCNLSAYDVAEAVAATASPAPSPLCKPFKVACSDVNSQSKKNKISPEQIAAALRAAMNNTGMEVNSKNNKNRSTSGLQSTMSFNQADTFKPTSPYAILPPPSLKPFPTGTKVRARSLSTSMEDSMSSFPRKSFSIPSFDVNHCLQGVDDPDADFDIGNGLRTRSNSTSAAMKRPAPYQMYSKCIIRRRSVVDGPRRVSFSASGPELIGPSRLFTLDEPPPSPPSKKQQTKQQPMDFFKNYDDLKNIPQKQTEQHDQNNCNNHNNKFITANETGKTTSSTATTTTNPTTPNTTEHKRTQSLPPNSFLFN